MNSLECLNFILSSIKLPRQFPKETTLKLCVEKIKQDLDRLEKLEKENISLHNKIAILESENLSFKKIIKEKSKLEKELKQTKLNFKNSQIHSKNRYKRLKEKYQELEKAIEILKNKQVDVCALLHLIKCGNDTPQYYNEGLEQQYRLTQEEYELLKKYLEESD